MTPNKHKMNKRQWQRWSEPQQRMFNAVYETGLLSERVMLHPQTPELEREHWNTIAWNFAFTAAVELGDGVFHAIEWKEEGKPCHL